jgi:hypothetical protein
MLTRKRECGETQEGLKVDVYQDLLISYLTKEQSRRNDGPYYTPISELLYEALNRKVEPIDIEEICRMTPLDHIKEYFKEKTKKPPRILKFNPRVSWVEDDNYIWFGMEKHYGILRLNKSDVLPKYKITWIVLYIKNCLQKVCNYVFWSI